MESGADRLILHAHEKSSVPTTNFLNDSTGNFMFYTVATRSGVHRSLCLDKGTESFVALVVEKGRSPPQEYIVRSQIGVVYYGLLDIGGVDWLHYWMKMLVLKRRI